MPSPNTDQLSTACRLLKRVTVDAQNIARLIEQEIGGVLETCPMLKTKPTVSVQAKAHFHDHPPPHRLSDLEYGSLSADQVRAAEWAPMVLMFMLTVNKHQMCLDISHVYPQKFRPKVVLERMRELVESPQSFLWAHLAWELGEKRLGDMNEMCQREERPGDDDTFWRGNQH